MDTMSDLLPRLIAALDLRVWTAGPSAAAPAGTQVIHRPGRIGSVVAVVTTDGQVVTGLDRSAEPVTVEVVAKYLREVALAGHRTSQQRRDLLRALLRRAAR